MNINDFLINETCSLLDAMAKLNKNAKKVLFVTKDNKFVASITDGDIRRWILKKGNLDVEVKYIANYDPKYFTSANSSNPKQFMRKHGIEALPILDENGDIISVHLWNDTEIRNKNMITLPVVIMAGGLGTRLYPYTKILPKPLIPVGDLPITEHIINRFHDVGCNDFHLILNHKANMIKAYFNELERAYAINYYDEEIPLGTGGGLSLLKNKIQDTFILTNCDILIEEDYHKIVKHHKDHNNIITMVCSLKEHRIPYGVIEVSENGGIEKMKEKPSQSFLVNTGMYIVEPQIIEDLKENESIGFPDIIKRYLDQGESVGIYPISDDNWFDMGQIDELSKMRSHLEQS